MLVLTACVCAAQGWEWADSMADGGGERCYNHCTEGLTNDMLGGSWLLGAAAQDM